MMQTKRIAITGGFGALGKAVIQRLREEGAEAIPIDLLPVPGDWEGLAIGAVDIAEPESAAYVIQEIARDGGLDGLVNIAGAFTWETVGEGSVESWDRLYRINVRTALSMSHAALPLLAASGGSIVNIGAAAATRAVMGMGAYAAAKSGVARLTEALADELKDRGVRVNAVLPSIIDTAPNRAEMPDAEFARWVRPDELADVIAYLLSDRASAITGALVPVTGRV